MEQFTKSVDRFLEFREYKILDGHGSISAAIAMDKAYQVYGEFNKTQKIESDFDREIDKLLDND